PREPGFRGGIPPHLPAAPRRGRRPRERLHGGPRCPRRRARGSGRQPRPEVGNAQGPHRRRGLEEGTTEAQRHREERNRKQRQKPSRTQEACRVFVLSECFLLSSLCLCVSVVSLF